MPQMRTSIKTRAGYRVAELNDGNKRCANCNRISKAWKGQENHAKPVLHCKLLGTAINPACICREYKPEDSTSTTKGA